MAVEQHAAIGLHPSHYLEGGGFASTIGAGANHHFTGGVQKRPETTDLQSRG